MILGLDISTSCIGWSLLNSEGGLIDLGYIMLDKQKDLFCKAQKASEDISEISQQYDIIDIFVEENLQSFRSGFSSAKTLSTLAKFNGIISYIVYQITQIKPTFLNVNAARKSVGLKVIRAKDGGDPIKEQVIDWVTQNLNGYSWPERILKTGPRKGMTVLQKGCYDMADAYVIALSGFYQLKQIKSAC